MEKKIYDAPQTRAVKISNKNLLGAPSPIHTGEPDQPAAAREQTYLWDDDDDE